MERPNGDVTKFQLEEILKRETERISRFYKVADQTDFSGAAP